MSQADGLGVRRLAVIGAGLAGLACARAAQNAGLRVVVFEKSRGLGGRLATRRPFGQDDAFGVDHGAPYAEPSQRYPDAASRLAALGAQLRWSADVVGAEEVEGAVVGEPGMSDLVRGLADGLARDEAPLLVQRETEIVALAAGDEDWLLRDARGGSHGPFHAVAVAAPAPQSRALLGGACPERETDAAFHPVLAIMAAFDPAPSETSRAAVLIDPEPPLARVYRMGGRQGRAMGGREAWVGHASIEWSSYHLEQEKNVVAKALLPALAKAIGLEPGTAPVYLAGHRWRYGVASRPVGRAYWLSDPGDPVPGLLGCCGDWRLGPKAGDALASGERLGQAIAARLAGGREA